MRSRRGSRFWEDGSRGSASAPNSVRRGPRSRSASMGCAIRLRVARGDGPRSSWCASAAPSRPASRRTAALVLTLRLAARRPRRLPLGCSWAAPPAVGWPRARCDVHWSQMSSKTSPPRPNRFHCTMGAADPDLSRASRSPWACILILRTRPGGLRGNKMLASSSLLHNLSFSKMPPPALHGPS